MSAHIVNADHLAQEPFSLAAPAGRRRNLVSLTPLIDVVFILLIFFMLASNFFDWQELPLTTSVAERSVGSNELGAHILLAVNGEIRLDGEAVGLSRVLAALRQTLRHNPTLPVQLEPAPGVSLQTLMALFDRLVQMGVQQIELVTGAAKDERIPPSGTDNGGDL